MNCIQYSKPLKVKYETDVFIAGGGPSGIAAAVAAARAGQKVLLIESQGSWGGAGTVGLVPAFMPFTDGVNFLAGGIGRQIHDEITGSEDIVHGSIAIPSEKLKVIYDKLLINAGVDFSLHTSLIDIISSSEGHLKYVIVSAKSGIYAIKAKVFVDATGDGDLCAWAGADWEFGDEDGITMPATLCSMWAGIDFSRVRGHDNRALEQAITDGVFKYADRHLPGMWKINDLIGGGNIGHCFNVDATDERSLTQAMLRGREYMDEYANYYKNYITGYENMELCATGAYLGVRESRRISCDYKLDINDFKSRANFDDEIGRFSYPVDIHIMTPDKEAYDKFYNDHMTLRYKKGESYGIPYASLRVKGLSNVLVVGRCICSDRYMQSSIRVMPACYITGQAAGTAAAIASKSRGDIRSINMEDLVQNLLKLGAYLPNAL